MKTSHAFAAFAAWMLAFTTCFAASAEPIAVQLTIRADQPGAKIDANIYGQFMEHLGRNVYEGIWVGENSTIPNTRGYRNDVLAALKNLQVPVLRWPGGCFADEYLHASVSGLRIAHRRKYSRMMSAIAWAWFAPNCSA